MSIWCFNKEAVRAAKKFALKAVILIVLASVGWLFVKEKKQMLVREGADFLQTLLSRESKLNVQIGKISGKFSGIIRFDDIRLEDPNLPAGLNVLFSAKRIEFRYRLLDFLAKKFDSKIVVNVFDAEVYKRPKIGLRSEPFPLFGPLRDLAVTQRRRFEVHVKNLKLVTGWDRREFPAIAVDYDNERFEISLPFRHYNLLGNDLSTEIHLRGRLEWGLLKSEDSFVGRAFTEGTVVNWTPLPWESSLDFTLTRERFRIDAGHLFGGFDISGEIAFRGEGEVDLLLQARDYPLKNFEPFFGRGEAGSYDGHLNLEAQFRGSAGALNTEAHVVIVGGKAGKGHYQSMNLHVAGIYPTLKLSNSHLLMEDGVVMKFAEETIEFPDLFSGRTYRRLISKSSQDNVSLGDWGFKRPIDENRLPEFLMERSLGKHARLQFRKYNEPEEKKIGAIEEKSEVEVGFEYHLRSKDSLQYRVREDEQFVGVERKMSF